MSAPLDVPELSLVVLIGASGAGKSSFARKHFKPTEILSSDFCRGLVSDDENNQSATDDAFDVLHFIARKRLAKGKLTVIDATNVQPESRRGLVAIAREFHCLPVAIVLDLPERICHERNATRPDRTFGPHVVRQQTAQLRRSLRDLKREGFRHVHILSSLDAVEAATIERKPLWNDRRHEHGPFDVVGDIHGCYDELVQLLEKLGYAPSPAASDDHHVPPFVHPEGRKIVFLGDLVDRGPSSPAVLRLAMSMVARGSALCVPGNHDTKLLRKLNGKDVKLTHGLQQTMAQLEHETDDFKLRVARFIDSLVSHYVLDDGKLVVAHAGLKEELQGRGSGVVRDFCLFGETTGETDDFGLPIRHDWAATYRGPRMVVYGHTPTPSPEWVNRTICIDTGCVYGGALTALRYPEKELVQVDAAEVYYEPERPLFEASEPAPVFETRPQDQLDLDDVAGKRIIQTRVHHTVTIREEHTVAALEVMTRFAVDPRWLIYLPPTMSPCETAKDGPFLEHPRQALDYYRAQGTRELVCEEKHMGSRAVLVVCRDADTARRRFHVAGAQLGVCYTRTGRPFFTDTELEAQLVRAVIDAMEKSGLWEELATDWVCLDTEIMPWSAKAQELLRRQYAAVGAAGSASLRAAEAALRRTNATGADLLRDRIKDRLRSVDAYRDAYRRYCWPVHSFADYRVAPFHLLASEGAVHTDRSHAWHMDTLARLAIATPETFVATPYVRVALDDPASVESAIQFWEQLTARGGEGMVVKPSAWLTQGPKGLVQPAVKCRGREYLRIIYGPEYAASGQLDRLRARGLGRKRSLAMKEFALGVEGLQRFVEGEPLYRVHECSFGVLALETEPIDPRL